MPNRVTSGRVLPLVMLAAALALWSPGTADAGGSKVPRGDDIKAKIESLYNGKIALDKSSDRERVIVEVEKILQKDSKMVALKTPEFWVEAVQEGQFATGGSKKIGKQKALVSEDIDITTRFDKPDDKPRKAKLWYRAGGLTGPTKPGPLLVTILEKGTDPKAYLEGAWVGNEEIQKHWVVAAIAEGDEFPVSKDFDIVARPFAELRERFNIDANRWYLEGVASACTSVQSAASTMLATRLAGLVLRGPVKAVTSANSALFPTVVVHGTTSAEGKAVAEAYKKVDEKSNSAVEVADLPSVTAMNEQLVAWFGQHARRTLPATSTFVTTITETDGETWTGSLFIVAPGKRGQPTKVTTKYLRETNTVDIQCDNLGEFFLYMNDDLLDLDKEVSVFVNGTALARKVFDRDLRDMIRIADSWGEWGRMFSASYRGVVPTKIAPPAPPAPPANPDPNQPPAQPPAPPPAQPDPPK